MLPNQTGHLDDDALLALEKQHIINAALDAVVTVPQSRAASQGATPLTEESTGFYDEEGVWHQYTRCDIDAIDGGGGCAP